MPRSEVIPALCSGFAKHRAEPGKPLDHWLPPEIYDEEIFDVDSAYLYIITDGNVGIPRAKRKPKLPAPAASTALDVCDPDAPETSSKVKAESKASVAYIADGGASSAPAPASGSDGAGGTGGAGGAGGNLEELLADLSLEHLRDHLAGLNLQTAATEVAESRPVFLNALKARGVAALKDRQSLANGISKARRAGRI